MSTGVSASLTVTIGGTSASSYGQELDLEIDPAGDLLQVDARQQGLGGDVLIVTPGILTFTGVTAALLVVGDVVALATETGLVLETEDGQSLEIEA